MRIEIERVNENSKDTALKYSCVKCHKLSMQSSECGKCKKIYCSVCSLDIQSKQLNCVKCNNVLIASPCFEIIFQEICKVEVLCKNQACEKFFNLAYLEDHEEKCDFKPVLCGKCLKSFRNDKIAEYEEHIKCCEVENYFVYEEKLKNLKGTYKSALEEFRKEIESHKQEVDQKINEYEKIYDLQRQEIAKILKSTNLKDKTNKEMLNLVFYPECKAIFFCLGKKNGCDKKKNVWGNNPYSVESELCRAALNSGFITEEGGMFEVVKGGVISNFEASNRNGVSTLSYGRAPHFIIKKADSELIEVLDIDEGEEESAEVRKMRNSKHCGRLIGICRGKNYGCMNLGNYPDVWGENPYSGDSNMCSAALNSGSISKSGGIYLVEEVGPRESFKSCIRNDIRTLNWGFFENSFLVKKF